MNDTIFNQNVTALSLIVANYIRIFEHENDEEIINATQDLVAASVSYWYEMHGLKLSPRTELIEPDAIRYAAEQLMEVETITNAFIETLKA
jgi:hypothetical protein